MPAPVFYSVCPFGTGTVETGAGNITVAAGIATLTVAQTGNIGAGVRLDWTGGSCWIAPNRIAFTSGGTAELLIDTKIAGGTSGATGIVRFVEVTGGTWAGGNAAGWIYFESTTGTWNSSEQINRTKPTTSNNIATTNGSFQGNIGNGNTQFVVKSATGGEPAEINNVNLVGVFHEYASLSAFEAGFTGAGHIGNASLVAADVVAHACCYYDHDNYTVDSTAVILDWSGTEDATRYLQIFTPMGGAESINKQRHDGVWDANKYNLTAAFTVREEFTKLDGFQVSGYSYWESTAVPLTIKSCIFKRTSVGAEIIRIDGDVINELYVINTIVYGDGVTPSRGVRTESLSNDCLLRIFHCDICGCLEGLDCKYNASNIEAQNCAVFNSTDDFVRGENFSVCSYNASDDGDGTNAVDWTAEATDWANVFNSYATGDFTLNNFTGTGKVIEMGTSLASSDGIWRDIKGEERGSTPDIGAFEYVSAGPPPSGSVTSVFYGPLVGPFGGPL